MRKLILFVMAAAMMLSGGISWAKDKYEPTWKSLAKHNAEPEWLKDAKLGIYFHWGPYAVPAYGSEWYPRHMYMSDRHEFSHHKNTYGDQAEFGYHHFIPDFTGTQFDPEDWAELFRKSGARFAGPVAEHHDGYSMWDSEITPWNARDTGPKRDILGELFQSLEKRNMKTIATFHHARNLQRNDKNGYGEDNSSHYPYHPDWHTSSEDPQLRLLYGNVPEDEWLETVWLGKLKEVIDTYHPDAIWFDSWLDRIPEDHLQRFSAYYLNAADKWGKDVAIIRKQQDLPLNFSINDHEKSREPAALPELWMTDDTISTGSWCYTDALTIKPLHKVLHALIDTVSKNGVVLLNISPKADGTIPVEQREVLLGLGAWLERNGEAIYNTRPWFNAAEGPTAEPEGGFKARNQFLNLEYSAEDIRYTASRDGKTVYAIALGVPKTGSTMLLTTFSKKFIPVKSITTLDGRQVKWRKKVDGLQITVPAFKEEMAVVFKISL